MGGFAQALRAAHCERSISLLCKCTCIHTYIYGIQGEKGSKRWEDLHKRVVQHNIRVVSTYYTDIKMPRLSELLELPPQETEKAVCDMVVDKSMWCRIDRLKVCASVCVCERM
jgi:hypothetical protein